MVEHARAEIGRVDLDNLVVERRESAALRGLRRFAAVVTDQQGLYGINLGHVSCRGTTGSPAALLADDKNDQGGKPKSLLHA